MGLLNRKHGMMVSPTFLKDISSWYGQTRESLQPKKVGVELLTKKLGVLDIKKSTKKSGQLRRINPNLAHLSKYTTYHHTLPEN